MMTAIEFNQGLGNILSVNRNYIERGREKIFSILMARIRGEFPRAIEYGDFLKLPFSAELLFNLKVKKG